LGDPGDAGAAAAIRLAGVLALAPLRRRRVLVGTPGRAAGTVATYARGGVDPRVAGEDDPGSRPAVAIGGLFVLAEAGLGEGAVDVGQFVIAQEDPGKDDRQLAPAPVPTPARPARMAGPDHSSQVDAHLKVV